MALRDFFIHTVTIKHATYEKLPSGGRKLLSTEPLHEDVPACVQPIAISTSLIYQKWDVQCNYLIYTDYDVSDVVVGDLIYFEDIVFSVTGKRNFIMNGRVYEIAGFSYAS